MSSYVTYRVSYEQNAKEALLLRLPVEVRQRIYELVLGGHHIQIETVQHMLLARAPETLERGAPSNTHLTHECAPISGWYDRPDSAVLPDVPLYQLMPLARVCRQFHQETSLLLYQLNVFTFESAIIMRRWLESRKPVQVRALRKVLLPWRPMYRGGWQQCLFHQHRKHLTGLVEVYDWNRETQEVERRWDRLDFDDKIISAPFRGQLGGPRFM